MSDASEKSGLNALFVVSDGGGNRSLQGAAAAILVDKTQSRRIKVVLQLGPADGVEAELAGGILAALLLERVWDGALADASVIWLTDSSYIIRTIGELRSTPSRELPEKFSHRGMWSVWKSLPTARVLRPVHVRAHSGNRENEACDRACRWIQRSGMKLLCERGEGPVGLDFKKARSESWQLFDLSPAFTALLEGEGSFFLEKVRGSLKRL